MTYMSTTQADQKAAAHGTQPAGRPQWTPEAREAHRAAQESAAPALAPTPTPAAKAPPSQPTPQDAPSAADPQHYTRMARAGAILHLVTPQGISADLTVNAGTPQEEIAALLKVVSMASEIAGASGWTAASAGGAEPAGPSANELAQGPTFAGYPCSPTIDAAGLPTWIIVGGKQCLRHSKQSDVWWSLKLPDGTYEQVLKIGAGEIAPAVKGL